MKEGKFPNTRKPYYWWVCGKFQNLRRQHNWEGKKKNPQIMHLNHNSQRRSSPDTHIHQQGVGAEQGGADCMLRVRTRPECPED